MSNKMSDEEQVDIRIKLIKLWKDNETFLCTHLKASDKEILGNMLGKGQM
jgi:hypothetical protein